MRIGLGLTAILTRYAAYIVMAWLSTISTSLVAQGQFLDIAVRDVGLALGASMLAKLSEVRELALLEDAPGRDRSLTEPNATQHLAHIN